MPEEQSHTIMAVDELQAIIQRCQILEEADFRGEDYNLFQVAGQKCLEDGYAAQLLEVIQNVKNKVIIKNMGWNLTSPLVRCILAYKQEDEKREHCLKILDQLVQLCNPKELFLGLLEQIEQASGEQVCQTIMLLLQPLQTVLLKLQNKKAYSVGLSLAMIMNQLTPLPVPYTKQQIQEDKLGLCQCCNAVVNFAKPFVNEVKNVEKSSEYNDMELKEELLKFCMKSLKYPLLTAQLEQVEGIEEHPFRHFAAEIIDILLDIRELMPQVFLHHKSRRSHWENEEFEDIERKNSADSLACLSYLVFVQHFGINYFPVVFSPAYLLQCNMTHIGVLLKRTEESVLSKGLDLFESSLLRMEDNGLFHQYLEFREFIDVPQDLVKVMTLCPIEHLRKKSLNILQLFIDKFEAEGKYTLFRCLLKTSNHAGVEGYIIKNIKDQIHLSLTAHDNVWFTGHHLISLLDLVLLLPEGAETDLLQNSDRIMASLNLLRYLVIKDCESDNQTGVWTALAKIEKNFLKPLHVGLNMSKAHYEAEIKNKKENRRESQSSNTICSLTVSGEKMPAMTTEMQLQVLHSALFTFDLIESVLARVEELIEVKLKAVIGENI
ncbi:glomulin isoform X2 [Cyrtonyx montezumae]|uniref:glomulin isoform X2 n=1 Tax=Cyrtonyx montezumae TaxID=9017 RepID=UPI0032DB7235